MILVGVMHAEVEPWSSIAKQAQIPSWELQKIENINVVYFYGRINYFLGKVNEFIERMRWSKFGVISYGLSALLIFFLAPFKKYTPKYVFHENKFACGISGLEINLAELTCTMRWKKIAFLKYFLNETNSEFAVITTTSSILNLNNIAYEITKLKQSNKNIYAGGPIGNSHHCEFISGSFTIISRSAAKLLLTNLEKLPTHTMDDVGFGLAFKLLGITPFSLSSISFKSIQEINIKSLDKFCHYRFKSGTSKNRYDKQLMQHFLSEFRFTEQV